LIEFHTLFFRQENIIHSKFGVENYAEDVTLETDVMASSEYLPPEPPVAPSIGDSQPDTVDVDAILGATIQVSFLPSLWRKP